jgi:hypothetical protein
MGNFARVFGLSVLALAISAASYAAAQGHSGSAHGSVSAHRGFSVHTAPGLPGLSTTHVPFVGDQNWGYGGGYPSVGYHRGGLPINRPYRYPGLLAFPFVPFYDSSDYAGDPYSYNQPPPDPSEGYGPVPYAGPPPQYAMSDSQPAMPPQTAYQQPPEPLPPLVVVLQNGQKLQLSNYAVVDDVLWDFSRAGGRKIPVSSIDLAASAKATEDAGGEFPQFSAPGAAQ